MAILAWENGLYLVGRLSQPMLSPVSVASHLIEHPLGYDGSPEHMLMTLGASMWVRNGAKWYREHCPGLYMEDVLTKQLTSVVMSMAQLCRLIKDPPHDFKLDPETEDLIWSLLVRASADNHALTGDSQIVQFVGWIREGVVNSANRWGREPEGIYETFVSASEGAETIIKSMSNGAHPAHRRWRANVRPQRGITSYEIHS